MQNWLCTLQPLTHQQVIHLLIVNLQEGHLHLWGWEVGVVQCLCSKPTSVYHPDSQAPWLQ